MIIGYDASRAFIKNRTGTENYSYQILRHLAQIDHKNTYYVYLRPNSVIASESEAISSKKIAASPSALPPCGTIARNDETHWPNNFKFITIPYSRLWTQAGLAIQTMKDPLDVLFVPAHTLPLIRKPGLKTVVTVHDLGAEFLPQTHQLKQRLYLNFMTNHQLKSATHLIAVSKATKQDLINKVGIPSNNITVIYEGINTSLFTSEKMIHLQDCLNKFDLKNQNYFLFVGSIQPRKNLIKLITAYAKFLSVILNKSTLKRHPGVATTTIGSALGDSIGRHSDLQNDRTKNFLYPDEPPNIPKLVLAGGKGWMADEIYALPKKLGIEDYVMFLGFVPDSDLPALYQGSLGFLFPSLFEGFGLPVLEAMASGCPVLTSNTSSLPEVAGKAAILVNPYSEEEIAQGILKLYQDQKLRKELKTLGIAQSKKFSWAKAASETLKILEYLS